MTDFVTSALDKGGMKRSAMGKPPPQLHSALPRSLMEGVSGEVEQRLGIASLKHRGPLKTPAAVDGAGLVRAIYDRIKTNYDTGNASKNRDRSAENWRWPRLVPSKDLERNSPEVKVERAIAQAAMSFRPDAWGNQIPVASGLIDGARERRRAIDLVRKHANDHFELIELKIKSDTPLYAAVEILGYGCLWLLAHLDRPTRHSPLLDAQRLGLQVLAPAKFYRGLPLQQLEESLDEGIRRLGSSLGVDMHFSFRVLDAAINADALPGPLTLLRILENSPRLILRTDAT